jgi:hypothetical protein
MSSKAHICVVCVGEKTLAKSDMSGRAKCFLDDLEYILGGRAQEAEDLTQFRTPGHCLQGEAIREMTMRIEQKRAKRKNRAQGNRVSAFGGNQ